ncbi:MAG TPA: hypothetical protein VIW24_24110 [Aldersonia sp.]
METTGDVFKPPYMSFQTFWNFITELGENPLPPRIDRSIMNGKSGTDQANLFLALTSFGLIDDQAKVLPLLSNLTSADADARKSILRQMITEHYVEPMRVSSDNGTTKDLEDAFKEGYPSIASADTRRKAITFFLHAARVAGLELSVHFPKTRSGQGAPGAARARKPTRRKLAAASQDGGTSDGFDDTSADTSGDTYTVELDSGGTVSVVVKVNLFRLTTADRDFVIDLVDKLRGYRADAAAGAANGHGDKNGPSEEGPSGQPSGDGGGVTPE